MDVAHCYLEGDAEVVEFCLHDGYQQVLAASTYTLQEGEQPIRAGSISLFDVNAEKGNLELFHRMDTAGIFDIKWSTVGSNVSPLLAQADADGYLRIYSLETDAQVYVTFYVFFLVLFSSLPCCHFEDSSDSNPTATSVSVGLSDGSVSITTLAESKIEKLQGWKAHDFELWTTCFDIHQPQLILEQNNGSYYDILEKRLEQVPGGVENKRNVYIAKSSPPNVSKAYFEQFRDDFLRVLRFRSEEMITGGRILLLTSLSEGDYRNGRDFEDDICNENFVFENSKSGRNVANCIRAITESLVASHFGETIIDDLFSRYAQHVGERLSYEKTKQVTTVVSMTMK
ncbi:hypothetical protein ES332_D07G157800v1 [Gossypium tomentosum]|uniref:Uncharacterized protein n=1 Tax=Gossypium tomentosum TaxID=34277 RepID=A0A5D2K787_GOSTO|nr:hypothetical protein ES332_D07G157800v1 [Gossypium tomentosum]